MHHESRTERQEYQRQNRIVGLRSRHIWTLGSGIRRTVAMSDRNTHVLDLYTRHPISAQQIIAKVRASRGHLENLTPEDLYPHDQDHYGGLSANDALAERASIRRDEHVADFCAGLGGPARYWSRRFGAEVTGIDLNPARVRGAAELTALVGLEKPGPGH